MKEAAVDETKALHEIISLFAAVDDDARRRILRAVSAFFDIQGASGPSIFNVPPGRTDPKVSFSGDRTSTPKEFLLQKQPRTDIERVACLAYYLAHFRSQDQFKTADISKLNTEAAQVKFSNAADSVSNAQKGRYIIAGARGMKQLSAQGEQFVLSLPDRDLARSAMANQLGGRRKRKTKRRT